MRYDPLRGSDTDDARKNHATTTGRAVGHPLTMTNQQTEADKAIGQTFDHELDSVTPTRMRGVILSDVYLLLL